MIITEGKKIDTDNHPDWNNLLMRETIEKEILKWDLDYYCESSKEILYPNGCPWMGIERDYLIRNNLYFINHINNQATIQNKFNRGGINHLASCKEDHSEDRKQVNYS